jgi:hypothetical protein
MFEIVPIFHVRKPKSSMLNITKKELKSLRLNKDIRILQAGRGNCTVLLDESKYKYKLNTLLEFRVYETFPKDPTTKVERKVQKILSEHKTALPTIGCITQQTSTSTWSSQDSQPGHL